MAKKTSHVLWKTLLCMLLLGRSLAWANDAGSRLLPLGHNPDDLLPAVITNAQLPRPLPQGLNLATAETKKDLSGLLLNLVTLESYQQLLESAPEQVDAVDKMELAQHALRLSLETKTVIAKLTNQDPAIRKTLCTYLTQFAQTVALTRPKQDEMQIFQQHLKNVQRQLEKISGNLEQWQSDEIKKLVPNLDGRSLSNLPYKLYRRWNPATIAKAKRLELLFENSTSLATREAIASHPELKTLIDKQLKSIHSSLDIFYPAGVARRSCRVPQHEWINCADRAQRELILKELNGTQLTSAELAQLTAAFPKEKWLTLCAQFFTQQFFNLFQSYIATRSHAIFYKLQLAVALLLKQRSATGTAAQVQALLQQQNLKEADNPDLVQFLEALLDGKSSPPIPTNIEQLIALLNRPLQSLAQTPGNPNYTINQLDQKILKEFLAAPQGEQATQPLDIIQNRVPLIQQLLRELTASHASPPLTQEQMLQKLKQMPILQRDEEQEAATFHNTLRDHFDHLLHQPELLALTNQCTSQKNMDACINEHLGQLLEDGVATHLSKLVEKVVAKTEEATADPKDALRHLTPEQRQTLFRTIKTGDPFSLKMADPKEDLASFQSNVVLPPQDRPSEVISEMGTAHTDQQPDPLDEDEEMNSHLSTAPADTSPEHANTQAPDGRTVAAWDEEMNSQIIQPLESKGTARTPPPNRQKPFLPNTQPGVPFTSGPLPPPTPPLIFPPPMTWLPGAG